MPLADLDAKQVWYDEAGTGRPLVLIHAGVTDSAMWDEHVAALAERYRVIRYDQPGFGRSPLPPGAFSSVGDLATLLDRLGIERASLVGLSIGARIALEYTLVHPDHVDALVLVAAGLPEHDWSDEAKRASAEEDERFEADDIDGAAEGALRTWVDGPGQPPDRVDPAVRERVHRMLLRAFELWRTALEEGEPGPGERLDPPASTRLAEIAVPTLVLVGDLDTPDILEICDRLAAGIPGARKVVWSDVAHLLPLERPDEFTRLLLDFLEESQR